ncbi:MAG: hypothetical protein BYD32DRAFT_452229 [Podila humilis]|nr:MAG: hypothetical protein BYD32DRAFT_452229 [Podila humilis]
MPPAWNRHRLPMNTLNPLPVPDPLFMTDELVDTIHPPIDDAHQGAVEGTLDLSDIISLEDPPGTIHPAQQLHSHGEMNSTPVTQAQLTSASCTTASSTLSTIFSRLSYTHKPKVVFMTKRKESNERTLESERSTLPRVHEDKMALSATLRLCL